jgi:hypothetical protein
LFAVFCKDQVKRKKYVGLLVRLRLLCLKMFGAGLLEAERKKLRSDCLLVGH